MMRSETILEFLPVDVFRFFMSFNIRVPLIHSGTFQLVRSKQNLLTVVALDNL
jgi:hypothetical protein